MLMLLIEVQTRIADARDRKEARAIMKTFLDIVKEDAAHKFMAKRIENGIESLKQEEDESSKYPEDVAFGLHLNHMVQLLESRLITISAKAFSVKLIPSDARDAASDAKASHAKTYTSKILSDVLKAIETSDNPEDILQKFIGCIVSNIGGAACKEVAKRLKKGIEPAVHL